MRCTTLGAALLAAGLAVGLGGSAPVATSSSPQFGRGGAQGPSPTAKPMYKVGGLRHGMSAFPRTDYPQLKPRVAGEVDFQHYHGLEEANALLKAWASKYPDLVDLYSVGKSFEGRDIWQMTITGKKAGRDTDKPAFFMEGGRHSGEISGIEATLYLAHHLLSGYGRDPEITRLVDTRAFYLKPNNNPDGNALYHYTAQSNRSTVRPNDDDGDGLLDEDPGDDLDGDGFIRQMRKYVGPGKGTAKKHPQDPSGRLMQRGREGEGDYVTYSEGIDNDLDGRYNEDGIGGLDLHRNYPENWRPMREMTGRAYTQGGAGEFPLSETETRAVFSFLLTHPNVGAAQSCDTVVPMILRGPSTSRAEEWFEEDAALYKKFDKAGQEITGYPWAGDTYHDYATRGAGGPPAGAGPTGGEMARGDSPLFGHGPDFGFLYFGVPWYGDEIWNGGRYVDYNKDGRVDEIETLRWNDENRAGKGDYMPWTAFTHPQLGEVEIGGWNPKFYSQNPPPELMETWAKNEAMFNLYLARQLPQVRVAAVTVAPVKAAPAGSPAYEVTATVTNEGLMPTALEIAKRVKIVRPDAVTLGLAQGQEIVRPEPPPAAGKKPARTKPAVPPPPPLSGTRVVDLGWLKAGETKVIRWQVKGTGAITVSIASTRGGVDRKDAVVQ